MCHPFVVAFILWKENGEFKDLKPNLADWPLPAQKMQ